MKILSNKKYNELIAKASASYIYNLDYKVNILLGEKIDKAIEYLKAMQNSDLIFTAICEKELLEILEGKENENN